MAMAYAALLSLAQILDQIFVHVRNQLLYDKQQIESLREKVGFLQEFIEDCDQQKIQIPQDLENQIKDVAHLAEDIIETKMVDDILGISPRPSEGSTLFCPKIEELIQEFDSIKEMVTTMKESEGVKDGQLSRTSHGTNLSSLTPGGKIGSMVGFEEPLIQVMDELTGDETKRQILPIVGMGGIGKTTLCRNVFENPLIMQHFRIRAWITVSQEYSVRGIILRLLSGIREYRETTQFSEEQRDDQLGEQLHKCLWGRKYLIVMDDIWSIEVWDKVKRFLPDNGNGSRIMVTTRLSDLANQLSSGSPHKMDFLDENNSWSLLCQIVFGQEKCPVEFEDIGKQIARDCKGLPLAIVVVGGLLSKSDMTREYWKYVAEHLSSIVNSENDEHCLNILSLSYKQLPVHLKPCFLYMGIFPEDREVRVSKLIKLWVAEGFLKPVMAKSLEEVAEEYLKDLIDRNLVLVRTRKSNSKMKSCGIHDLMRDLCIKVAHEEGFFCVITVAGPGTFCLWDQSVLEEVVRDIWDRRPSSLLWFDPSMRSPYSINVPSSIKDTRRFVIRGNTFVHACQIHGRVKSSLFSTSRHLSFHRLLRIVYHLYDYSPENIQELVNSRYLAFTIRPSLWNDWIPGTIELLRNLQTLVISSMPSHDSVDTAITLPYEIWEMPQLKHIEITEASFYDLADFLHTKMDSRLHRLDNLQTLSVVRNFSCDSKDVLERIPNLKKLEMTSKDHKYNLNNLVLLRKLESLSCLGFVENFLGNQVFPDSIKKLTLKWSEIPWEHMSIIGSLPNLEVLKLKCGSFHGEEWNTKEGDFLTLKFLLLECLNLCHWETESSHFPRLESLIIRHCDNLEEIPFDIGEIPTLKLIELYGSGEKVKSSAEQIQEEQRNLGNEDLQVLVEGYFK